jgi:hypothetical protein
MASGYSPPQGPGPVAWAHRLTIATAVFGALAYSAWEFATWLHDGGAGPASRAALGVAVAGGFTLYLRHLRARLVEKLTPRRP